MSHVVQWDAKTPTEVVFRFADFTDELTAGEVVNSAATVATVWSGNDAAPNILGVTTVVNNTAGIAAVAKVVIQNGVLGTIYQCVITAPTSLGQTLTKTAVIAIKPPIN